MSSQINPNNINQNYPVAGIDNNSQGFRDNFTNIKNNFIAAKNELEDLKSKVVVKSPLTYGSTPTSTNNNFVGNQIVDAVFKQCSQAVTALGTLAPNGNMSLDFSTGSFVTADFYASVANTLTINISNVPTDTYTEMILRIGVTQPDDVLVLGESNGNAATVADCVGVWKFDSDTQSIYFAQAGVYDLVFATADGATYCIRQISSDISTRSVTTTLTHNVSSASTFATISSTNCSAGVMKYSMYCGNAYAGPTPAWRQGELQFYVDHNVSGNAGVNDESYFHSSGNKLSNVTLSATSVSGNLNFQYTNTNSTDDVTITYRVESYGS